MVSTDLLLNFLEKMLLIRKFEYKLIELAEKGTVRGSIHLCIGEEASAVGTCMAINKEDFILPTHRGHGQEIAKGSNIDQLLAEMIGKETGLCKGRVGSMHVFDRKTNNLGAQGILGAQIPISIGVGLAIKLKEIKDRLVMVFFGDGTTNQGTFYEGLNFAALWELPIIFVCINNLYGMGTRYDQTCKVDIVRKPELFNIFSIKLDGNDVEEIYIKTSEIAEKVKKVNKPALIELQTYRWIGHSAFDKHPYRTKEEINEWKKKDPINKLEQKLIKNNVDVKKIDEIKNRIDFIIENAEKFALESSYPEFDISMEN